MTPLHVIACFYDVGFGARAVSRKTPIYFILYTTLTQELRKGLSPTFSSGKIKGMLDLLDGGVNQMVAHLEEVTEKDSVVEVNIKDVFQKMTLDVIARSSILHEIK